MVESRVDGRVAPYRRLSPREREVAQAVIDGLRAPEIAARLGLSKEAVKFHLQNLRLKVPGNRPLAQRLVLWAAGMERDYLDIRR